MLDLFYEGYSPRTISQKFAWSIGSGNLPDFLRTFVRVHDCMLHVPDGLRVTIGHVSYSYTTPVLSIIVQLQWHPPKINFRYIQEAVLPGSELHIAPAYVGVDLDGSISKSGTQTDHVRYTMPQTTSFPEWDPIQNCFRIHAPAANHSVGLPGVDYLNYYL